MFMSQYEKSLIYSDFAAIVNGVDGIDMIATYQTPTGGETVDPVFGHRTDSVSPTPVTEPIRCIMKPVMEQNKKTLEFGKIEVGDCILYMLRKIDLDEAKVGFPVMPGTLYFVDPEGQSWEPVFEDSNERKRFTVHMLGNQMVQQAVAVRLKRD